MVFWFFLTGFIFLAQPQAGAEPFAVVELFASEGCSSCPPADDLLRLITSDARAHNRRVYTLSFEVDYWDYLGWKDPFSSAAFSGRQQKYAGVLGGSNVYTPQMIINGKEAFVGSDVSRAKWSIAHYLNVPARNTITLILDQTANDLKVTYACAQQVPHAVVNFALVERDAQSHVTAGENAGRTLVHDNIVREFKTVAFKDLKAEVVLSKPQAKDLSRFSVVAYLQSDQDMAILAASSRDLQ